MPKTKKPKKKLKKTQKGMKTKLIPMVDEDEDESGMYLDKESIQTIYNALHAYKPTEGEEHLHSVLLEEFEEILVVDYSEPYPDAN
jgi:hypothetical protein